MKLWYIFSGTNFVLLFWLILSKVVAFESYSNKVAINLAWHEHNITESIGTCVCVFLCIFMYLYVFVRICTYLSVFICICMMYLYVFVCIFLHLCGGYIVLKIPYSSSLYTSFLKMFISFAVYLNTTYCNLYLNTFI